MLRHASGRFNRSQGRQMAYPGQEARLRPCFWPLPSCSRVSTWPTPANKLRAEAACFWPNPPGRPQFDRPLRPLCNGVRADASGQTRPPVQAFRLSPASIHVAWSTHASGTWFNPASIALGGRHFAMRRSISKASTLIGRGRSRLSERHSDLWLVRFDHPCKPSKRGSGHRGLVH